MSLNIIKFLFNLFRKFLSTVGSLWLLLKVYNGLSNLDYSPSLSSFCLVTILLSLFLFIIDGYFFSGFLKREILISSNAFSTKIKLKFGDIFQNPGWIVVGVNDFFDSLVDEIHISSRTLHGQMLQKYWSGQTMRWDEQVNQDLKGAEPLEEITRPKGKNKRYKIGTVVGVKQEARKFLCVTLSKTNIETNHTNATSLEVHTAIKNVLVKARETCSGEKINFPVIGSGLSRTGVNFNHLINMILLIIFEECKKEDLNCEIRIILPKEKRNEVDLGSILKNWS